MKNYENFCIFAPQMKKTLTSSLFLVAALVMGGCSATRDLAEDEFLLNKVKVVTDGNKRDVNPSQLKNYVKQKGNTRWFQAFKIPLGVYAMAGKDSSWINRTLRSMGEAPVIFDTLLAKKTCDDLQQALQNKGFLDAQVELHVDRKKNHKLDAYYLLHPNLSYIIGTYSMDIRDSLIANLIKDRPTLITTGERFSVDVLNSERSDITTFLQNNGYFRFHKEYITYLAQKDEKNKKVNLTLILHPYIQRKGQDTLHQRYNIRHITYASGNPNDSIIHLRQHVLKENTFLEEGKPYSAHQLQNTYNHFGRLGAVKYTNISFEQVPDSSWLDTQVTIQTNKPSTISFQPEGTNTAGDLGAAASLTYQNRNLFRGSETFSIQLRGAYEAIRGLEGYSNQDYIEYSIESRLTFPRFIFPFLSQNVRRKIISSSEVSLTFDSQDRPEFHRRVTSAGWRYQWRPQYHHDNYRIDLIDLDYVFMPWISETFRKEYLENTSNSNAILRYNYENLFIMKMGFGYAYNDGRIALKANVETAGNLLNLSNHILGSSKDNSGHYRLFNIAYAQYAKADFDFSRYLISTPNEQLVFHFGMGIAYPYGNSTILPFEKRYFSGGANSVRGWSVRSLGPGKYRDKNGRINFITQTGDLKLDLNLEYRAHLFWKFNGAFFVDAGNIWTLRDYEEQPGGQFKFSNVLSDLAVSIGLGLRLNFDYFILRFDLGCKTINPAYESDNSDHYPILSPKLSRDLAFHFAVGMPF